MTSVSNCDSMDIRPKSESLSCPVLLRENDLIRFKEENDLSTHEVETGITAIKLQSKETCDQAAFEAGLLEKNCSISVGNFP